LCDVWHFMSTWLECQSVARHTLHLVLDRDCIIYSKVYCQQTQQIY
jgi:hypothetical protein